MTAPLADAPGGGVRAASAGGPFGHGEHPACDADLVAKWRRLTGGDGGPFLERLLAGDDGEEFAAVVSRARGSAR